MVKCVVKGCKNYSTRKSKGLPVRYFSFPREKELIKQWISVCQLDPKYDVNNMNCRVCSDHFVNEDYSLKDQLLNTPIDKRKLKKNAVPTVNISSPIIESNRSKRFKKRSMKKLVEEIVSTSEQNKTYCDVEMIETFQDNEIQVPEYVETVTENIKQQINCGATSDDNNMPKLLEGVIENQPENACTRNVGIQTMVDLDNALQLRVLELEKEVQSLKTKLKIVEKEKTISKNLKKFFTEGQIKKLSKDNKRIVWKAKDISSAISLHSAGPRLYRYLYRMGYPLPGASTLRNWASKQQLKPGILKCILDVMKDLDYNERERLCIISFDEMKVKSCYEYDKVLDSVTSPSAYVQVAMIRGLFKAWKQPIYYNFDSPMDINTLKEIIKALENINFTVVAVTSDLGSTNFRLRNKLQITEQCPFFVHPSDESKKIFVFADVPHLIKLIRNHFLDKGFLLNEKVINAGPIREVIQLETSDLKINHKVTQTHLEVVRAGRQKVKYAVQIFSHSMSACIRWCVSLGYCKSPHALESADFIESVNDWFDIFNSKYLSSDVRSSKKPYGLDIEKQAEILNKTTNIIQSLRVCDKKNLLPFQKGIITNNAALNSLFFYLKDKYKISYVLTNRLNQDVLENFFGIIRAKGGLNDHPTAIDFKYRLRSFILGRADSSLQVSLSSNTLIENHDLDDIPEDDDEVLSSKFFSSMCNTDDCSENLEDNIQLSLDAYEELPLNNDEFQNDSLQYVAGYIAKKLKLGDGYICEGGMGSKSMYTWLDELSQGGLKIPNEDFLAKITKLNNVFNVINGDKILIKQGYLKHLLNLSNNVDLREDIKNFFFRTRMYFRIRSLNRKLCNDSQQKKNKKTFT